MWLLEPVFVDEDSRVYTLESNERWQPSAETSETREEIGETFTDEIIDQWGR